jgi:hypothetical protein
MDLCKICSKQLSPRQYRGNSSRPVTGKKAAGRIAHTDFRLDSTLLCLFRVASQQGAVAARVAQCYEMLRLPELAR